MQLTWLDRITRQLLPTMIYSAYIWYGGSLDLAMVIVTKQYFGKLFHIFGSIP